MDTKKLTVIVIILSAVSCAQTSSASRPKRSGRPSAPVATKAADAPSIPAPAQAGPSLEETAEWIKGKIGGFAGYTLRGFSPDYLSRCDYSVSYAGVQLRGCELSWEEHGVEKCDLRRSDEKANLVPNGHSTRTYSINESLSLWDVSGVSIEPGNNYFVMLETDGPQKVRGQTKGVTTYDNGKNADREDRVYRERRARIGVGVPDKDNEDMAKRVASAFEHAVALCKQRKPASNEPF